MYDGLYVCVCRARTCVNPILPDKPVKKPSNPSRSKSLTRVQSTVTSVGRVKRVVKRKSVRDLLSPDNDDDNVRASASEPMTSKPGTVVGRRRGHKLFGMRKFMSSSSLTKLHKKTDRKLSDGDGSWKRRNDTSSLSSLTKLHRKTDRKLSDDSSWKRRSDPWRKRRSLLASDRKGSGTRSPRRIPSSSSLTSLSDTDGGKSTSSQIRNLLKVC